MLQEICCEYCSGVIKNNPYSINGHLRVCKKYRAFKKEVADNITYELLYTEYVINEKSATMIAHELGLKKPTVVITKLKDYNIKIRTLAESRFTKGYINSAKKTSKEKYGTEYHTSKDSTIRNDIDAAVKKKYNVDNVFQLDTVKITSRQTKLNRYNNAHYNNSDKVKKTCIKLFGVDNPWKNKDVIQKCQDVKNSKDRVYTYSSKKANALFDEICKQLVNTDHVHYISKGKEFGLRSKKDKKYYFYDFVDTSRMMCIEFNGNYWHANPTMYLPGTINKKAKMTSKQIWKRDYNKLKQMEDAGYKIKVVWESDYDSDPDKIISECINFLNN